MEYWSDGVLVFGLVSSASLSDTSVAASEIRHSRMLLAGIQANPNINPR
jgi:hypothetical protein